MDKINYDLIAAAVGGDNKAIEKIVQHFEPMIQEESKGDSEVRQRIVSGLIDAIRHYDLNSPEKNEEYLAKKFPDA